MLDILKPIATSIDRSAVSEVAQLRDRYFASTSSESTFGIARNGLVYDLKIVRRSFERALNGNITVSIRRELAKKAPEGTEAPPEILGFRERTFVFNSCGILTLASQSIGDRNAQGVLRGATAYSESVGASISWIQRLRGSFLCSAVAALYRQEREAISPFHGLTLPARDIR